MSHTNEVPTWRGNREAGALSAGEGLLTAPCIVGASLSRRTGVRG